MYIHNVYEIYICLSSNVMNNMYRNERTCFKPNRSFSLYFYYRSINFKLCNITKILEVLIRL